MTKHSRLLRTPPLSFSSFLLLWSSSTFLLLENQHRLLFVVEATGYIQEPYHLPFGYSFDAVYGPPNWSQVDITGNEWQSYINHEFHHLDRTTKNICHSKRRPSPINLVANQVCEDAHEILTRKIRPDDCTLQNLQFSITPHTLRADFPWDDSTCTRPTVDLPNGYPFTWIAHHVEVHLRAEHVLDGRRYDGELQMYHLGREDQRRELSVISVMLDASAQEDEPKLQEYIDQWETLAHRIEQNCRDRQEQEQLKNGTRKVQEHLFTSSTSNTQQQHDFNLTSILYKNQGHITRALDLDEYKYSRAATEVQDTTGSLTTSNFETASSSTAALSPSTTASTTGTPPTSPVGPLAPRRKMFPYDIWPTIHFYRYRGSLTSPPCTEFVSWRVLDEPLRISRRQYKALARLLTSYINEEDDCHNGSGKGRGAATSSTGETYRPLQELNKEYQNLTHCTEEDFTFRMYPPDQV
eukprot:CAMPEP_0195309110 /NCGR_PEP_ID=MMETSP0707-20130614/38572_1 /TAXON_ID=33640 /ORGANISM="Asterionellopsis glacialis, Strain CCMP134" /LENGTH=466 /DNA_ID=CAMNT_0040373407 /DNA_START=785 /DNA_END=2185 /DNA_ORIENTATION=-